MQTQFIIQARIPREVGNQSKQEREKEDRITKSRNYAEPTGVSVGVYKGKN